MIALQKDKAAVSTAAAAGSPIFPGSSDEPIIAIFMTGGGAYAPNGAIFGSSALLPDAPAALIMRDISAYIGARLGLGAAMPNIEPPMNRAEGMAAEQIAEFAKYLRRNRKEKTAQGYSSDVRNVLTVISSDFFNGVPLDGLDLARITAEQVQQAEQHLFKCTDLKPKTLSRLKQGWNSFCIFVGMGVWKFTEKVNEADDYKEDAISNAEVLKMLAFCQEQRQAATTDADRIRWFRKEIAIRLGWEMGFRSCEYGNAKFDEIEDDERITIKHSKHNGTRKVAATNGTRAVILEFKEFLKERNLYPAGGGIFEKPDGKNYSTSSFRRWFKAAAEACGVAASKAKTHGLRHRFARNFLAYTLNESMLSNVLGHKSPQTTRQYTTPTFENLREAMQASVDYACRSSNQPQAA